MDRANTGGETERKTREEEEEEEEMKAAGTERRGGQRRRWRIRADIHELGARGKGGGGEVE